MKACANLYLACLVLAPCLAQAAPFQNGGFEIGTNPPSDYTSLFTGSTALTSWTIGGRVDWSATPWHPHSGNESAQFVNNGTFLEQTFDTSAGQSYTLGFWLQDYYTVTTPFTVDASVAGSVYHAVFGPSPANTWHYFSTTFVATSTSTTLRLTNVDGGNVGPFLDDVTVTAVPEPATLAVLGLGALFFRRKSRA